MQKVKVILTILVLALFGIQNCLGQCYALPSPDSNEVRIFAQDVCGGVDNNPPNPTVFTIDQPRTITKIGTYHWNSGQGTQTPGTIGLQNQNGKTYGPWQASGQPGQGGVPNAYWIVTLPNALDLPAGTYKVVDSEPSTWAYNSESGNSGVVSVIGLSGSSTVAPKAPCAGEGVTDLSMASPTDQYRAGPSLAPGSYKIWYGKRTGTQIGQPDNWNTKPVELLDGKFYVFDVSTGDFNSATPQMINPMLSSPTPGESVVWYKASTQYAYVVCFDGPLNVDNTKVTQAPCGEDATDLSMVSPTDQYRAGPMLTPGSYNIWYGKRTGNQIGQPDNWNTKPVELLDGKFYVFDVSTGDFNSATPQMINPMLSSPTPGESVVWYKASAQYAYVVCFDGPLKPSQNPADKGVPGSLLEAVTVPSGGAPVYTTQILEAGKYYLIQAPGVFSYWDGSTDGADAYYDYRDQGAELRPLQIGDRSMYDIAKKNGDSVEYNPNHFYETSVVGSGIPLKFWILDTGPYSDNYGSLEVKVYRGQHSSNGQSSPDGQA